MAPISEEDYDKFASRVVSDKEFVAFNFPKPDPLDHSMREARDERGQALSIQKEFASSYGCHRCGKVYSVDRDGKPTDDSGFCDFHHRGRHVVYIRGYGYGYPCCKKEEGSVGCVRNRYHVHKDQPLLWNYSGYVETQPKAAWGPSQHGVYALNCLMCYNVYGQEVVRVAVVDLNCREVYNKFVKPTNFVLDYYTLYTGITERDLEGVETTLADVQRDLLELFSSETILVGHDLGYDLKGLKLFHRRIVDTVVLYRHPRGLPSKMGLRRLAKDKLGLDMAENGSGEERNCLEDATVAMRLAKKICGLDRR